MHQQSIIQEMRFDVQTKQKRLRQFYASFHYWKKTKEKKWKAGASGLFKSLINYYGETEGKRKWAAVIRDKRVREANHKKALKALRQSVDEAKAVLALAEKSL